MTLMSNLEDMFISAGILRNELTGHWQQQSSWKDLWVKGQSQSLSGRGRIPSAGCGESWPAGPDPSLDWLEGPGGCDPLTIHFPHQNYKTKKRDRENQGIRKI